VSKLQLGLTIFEVGNFNIDHRVPGLARRGSSLRSAHALVMPQC
jgi:hypothetical protein